MAEVIIYRVTWIDYSDYITSKHIEIWERLDLTFPLLHNLIANEQACSTIFGSLIIGRWAIRAGKRTGKTIVSQKTFHGCVVITRRVSQTTTLRFRAPAPLMDICITVKPQMLQLWNNEIVRGAGVRHPLSLSHPFNPATPTIAPCWCQLTPTSRALTWYRCFVELTS